MLMVHESDPIQLTADATHLAAVMLMFNPTENVGAIKPVRPWSNRRGRNAPVWSRLALDLLRRANAPMTTREIANRIAWDRGITDPKTVASIECSLHITLARRIGEGVLLSPGPPKRWTLE